MSILGKKYTITNPSEQASEIDDMFDDLYRQLTDSGVASVAVGNALISDGVGRPPVWGKISLTAAISGILAVINGGTGRALHTAYAVICGGTTTTGAQQSVASLGTSGQILTSNGAGALPSFQTLTTGTGAWVFVTSATPSGSGGIMSFTNLSAYNEILLVYKGIKGTPDFGFTSRVRVSTDNGSSYLNSSGDYVSLSAQGVETAESDMKMHSTVTSGAKTGWRTISNFNTTKPKNSWTPLDGGSYVIPTSTALNAIQIYTSTGLDWDTVGTIYIFGRT